MIEIGFHAVIDMLGEADLVEVAHDRVAAHLVERVGGVVAECRVHMKVCEHLRAFCRSVRYACERRKGACSPHQGCLLAVRPLCAACGVSSPQRCPSGPASQGRRARCAARLRARAHCAPPEAPRLDLLPRRCCVFFGRFAMTVYNVSRFCLNTRFMLLGFSTERFDRV